MVAVDGFAVFAMMVVLIATLLALLLSSSYLKREGLEGAEYFTLMLCSATGMIADGLGQRPRHDLPVARDPVDRAVRARRVRPAAHQLAGGRAQVLPARARSRRRCSSTASRSCTAAPVPPTSPGSPTSSRPPRSSTTACCCSASCSCSSGWASRSRRCRSTCGRPTCTRARPHRSPRSWPPRPRPRRSPRCCGCSSARSSSTASTGGRSIWVLAVLSLVVGSVAALVQTDVKRMLGVLVDQPRGLRAHRRAGRDRRRHERRARSTCSPTR